MKKDHLEYSGTLERDRPTGREVAMFIFSGLVCGVVFALPAVVYGFLSIGDHGWSPLARAIFLPTLVIDRMSGHQLPGGVGIALGLAQFPLYGVAMGWSLAYWKKPVVIAVEVGLGCHLVAGILLLAGWLPLF